MQRSLSPTQSWRYKPGWPVLALAVICLAAVMVLAITIGSVAITPKRIIQAIYHGLTGQLSGATDIIIWQLRLPRVLLAAVVGASLAVSGAAFQGLFRNPLADPYLLGVASGAGFGATLAMVSGISLPLLISISVPLAAFVTGLLAVSCVVALAHQGRSIRLINLILAGVVIGSTLSAATSFLMLLAREQAVGVLSWLLGSFSFSSWHKLGTVTPLFVVSFVLILGSSRALNLLQLGEDSAAQLGLNVGRFRLLLITAATLATAAAVSVSGIIGFVGLMIPHAVRLALGPDYRRLIPMSALLGAIFLILADLVARSLIAPSEIPIGVVTALVGGPFFLYLLRRRSL